MKSKKYKMILVEWLDAAFVTKVMKKDEALKENLIEYKTFGFLISKDKTLVRLVNEINEDDNYRGLNLIPTGCIISIKELEEKKIPKRKKSKAKENAKADQSQRT